MSSNDGTTPPVLFVVGTAGAGKSSLVTSFQRWARFLDIDVLAINLDPGAERVHYDPEFDVRDLISLSEVMDEYDLGPNGAQILAADLVASQQTSQPIVLSWHPSLTSSRPKPPDVKLRGGLVLVWLCFGMQALKRATHVERPSHASKSIEERGQRTAN